MSANEPAKHSVEAFEDVVAPSNDYRSGRAIVVEVTADHEIGRRIVDFFSGLAYGTDGTLEKVAERIYLLNPPG